MKKGYFSVGTAVLLSLGLFTSTYAGDACSDAMGHTGSGHSVSGDQVGSISGTPWGYEQWYQGGTNSMKYYDNGTFEASWSGSSDYLARVGYQYNPYISHKTKTFAVDYKYTKQGNASYSYVGVYGWTRNPDVEYYIVDGHIDISAHFNKWEEIFHGQTENLPTSKGGRMDYQVGFGNLMEVMLMAEAGGGASGSIDYTYFDMTDNGTPTPPPTPIERKPFGGTAVTLPGTVEAENFDEGDYGVSYSGTKGASGEKDAAGPLFRRHRFRNAGRFG